MESKNPLSLTILVLILSFAPCPLASPIVDESTLKAVFTYKFAKFTEWPRSRLGDGNETLNLCILGKDTFSRKAINAIANKEVKGRQLRIERFQSGLLPQQAVSSCHILFVSASERKRQMSILAELKNQPVLTVSDIEHFSRNGGMITLLLINQQLRFEINPSALQRAQLLMSSKLLELGTIIDSQDPLEDK